MGHGRKPRLLAVAHTFAPAAAIGVMRPLRLLRHLAAEGWDTTVLQASPRTFAAGTPLDPALLERVPESTRVIHAPVVRVEAAASRLVGAVRGRRPAATAPVPGPAAKSAETPRSPSLLRRAYNLVDELTTIPDKESGWIVPAVARGLANIAASRPDAIYSTAPPWTVQIVALALASATRVPWVADFRDPWARAPWRETQPGRIRRASVRLERRVVHRADAILFATRTNRDEYAAHYGEELASKFHVVPNGCDPEEFAHLAPSRDPNRFVMVHTGSLYGARSPVPVFQAIASAIASGKVARDRFRLRLIGDTSAATDFAATAAALGLATVVEFVPRMRRRDILMEMASASALLVLQPGTTVSIPGKLYEYLAVGRPILAISEEGELAALVRQSGVGVAVSAHDIAGIEAALARVMELADGTLAPAEPQLYDGNKTAADAAAIITAVARAGFGPSAQKQTG
jgi:glycosyltransferase involved in cell wall biosynthesis